MKAIINGKGNNGTMLNKIELNVFDCFEIKSIIEDWLKNNKDKEYLKYRIEKCEKFLKCFTEAITIPSKEEV